MDSDLINQSFHIMGGSITQAYPTRSTWIPFPAIPFIGWTVLGNTLKLSKPKFPSMKNISSLL